MDIIFAILFLAASISVVFLCRNQWVYRVRTDIIQADMNVYNSLPSYDQMMRMFWIWDAAKFIGMPDGHRAKAKSARDRGQAIIDRAVK